MTNTQKIPSIFCLFCFIYLVPGSVIAQTKLEEQLSGRIILQVQSKGEAWYVHPTDHLRYYLGRPHDALTIMQKLGLGITNKDIINFPIGIISTDSPDDDGDLLPNNLENALGTNPISKDTDSDGYDDMTEAKNGFDPLSKDNIRIDKKIVQRNMGRILLQTEDAGQAWYVNPADGLRYYLGKPNDALLVMKKLGLGISDKDITQIPMNIISWPEKNNPITVNQEQNYTDNTQDNNEEKDTSKIAGGCSDSTSGQSVINIIAQAIRDNDSDAVVSCFVPEKKKYIIYTMNFLDNSGKLTLANLLSGSKLKSSGSSSITYVNEIYFSLGGYKVPAKYTVKKQPDGRWLMENL